ncbi:MAG: hypothetical protein R3321_09435, partial [Nitrososphaeraceae archaeon]|nr:hypothetical protein [Nitrososphaeraceae archaeon]
MKKKFKAKTSILLVFIFSLIYLFPIFWILISKGFEPYEKQQLFFIYIPLYLLGYFLFLSLFYGINYIIENEYLKVNFLFFTIKTVPIST